jgi:hypothetical protein
MVLVSEQDINAATGTVSSPVLANYYYEMTGSVPVSSIQEWVETTLP